MLVPLTKTGLPIIKNIIKPLAKCFLIPVGLTAAASVADAGIHQKILGSGTTTLTIRKKWRNEWYNENYSSSWRF